ncbi:MAG TPA: hypothetical protein PLR99_28225 [Polyangiaceae bacterium]|jgi:hypothetical protein|nr:hypothetical protein [Polyangiaceae bacterium]
MRSIIALSAALTLASACSSTTPPADAGIVSDASPDAPLDASSDASSNVDASIRPTVRLTGTIAEGDGFEVCVYEHPEVACALSKNGGMVELTGVPASSELLVSVTKAGYVPQLRFVVTETADLVMGTPRGPFTPESMASETARVGVTFDAAKTTLVVAAYEATDAGVTPALGATFTLAPASGSGPFYLDEGNHLNPDTKGLTSQAGAWFVNLDPGEGEVVVKTSDAGRVCAARSQRSWASPKPNTLRIRNVPGYQTIAAFDCK